MTQEQKAKAYDEALERAKKWHNAPNIDKMPTYGNRIIEEIFPELKESEDERIRKELITIISCAGDNSSHIYMSKRDSEKYVAWLEKQGEQKVPVVDFKAKDWYVSKVDGKIHNIYNSVDKLEPKFHEGEWITNGNYTWKIVEIKPLDYILQSQDGNIVDDTISHVDEQFHSFTIQDAKDGDVLASELCDSIILFKGINDDNNIDFYCDYDFSEIDLPGDRFSVNNGQHYGNVEDSKDFHPATKEQRDALEKAMADAGYEFDFEKKELKKIEHKPAWSEEDERAIGIIKIALEHPYDMEGKWDRKFTLDWLKSLKGRCTWKPSDEQMNAIKIAIAYMTDECETPTAPKVLCELLEQLKKLTE